MKKYAVITTGGKQYQVSPGDKLSVEKLDGKEGDKLDFDTLLICADQKLQIGAPFLKTKVSAKMLGQKKGEKIRVVKFRAKSRYRRVKGHRQSLTEVEILPFSK